MKRSIFGALATVTLVAFAGQAQAAGCVDGVFSTAFVACAGDNLNDYHSGNALSNSPADRDVQDHALIDLLGLGSSPNYAALMAGGSQSKVSSLGAGNMLSFPITSTFSGLTYIGIHWGGQGGGQTAWYKFDFTTPVSSLEILGSNPGGFSGAVLYSTGTPGAVPEPATWAMLITGFGLAGVAMRRRKVRVAFS